MSDIALAAALATMGLDRVRLDQALEAARREGIGLAAVLTRAGVDPTLLGRAGQILAYDSLPTLPPRAGGSAQVQAPPSPSEWRRAFQAQPGAILDPPPRFGAYRIERLIARGGMGAVFVATQETIGRKVALKVLLSGSTASPQEVQRFLLEARASAKLNHPNVVPIYEVGEHEGTHFLTMELIEGPSLRQLVEDEGPMRPRRALELLEQAARGVAAAHAAGIVHRDVKPHNVLVGPGDVAKVMDFGLAKEVDSEGGLTLSGAILGTPAYMPPEQANGEAVGPLADVYSLGAVLYECLVGWPPFRGESLVNLIAKVLSEEPRRPREHRPELSVDVETICLKALEKKPERRYASAEALADDAARWLAGEAIAARPPTQVERIRRALEKNRTSALALTATFVALVGVLLYTFVLVPQRVAEELRRREAKVEAALEDEAQAFRDLHAQASAAAKSLAEQPAASERAGLAACAEIRSQALALREQRVELSAVIRERVVDLPPLGVGGLQAKVWFAVAERLVEESEGGLTRDQAYAWAYQAGPTTLAGRLALAHLAEQHGGVALDHYLRGAAVDAALPAGEARLRSARERLLLDRVRRRLARLQIGGALADLARLPPHEGPRLRRLARTLSTQLTLPLPPSVQAIERVRLASGPDRLLLRAKSGAGWFLRLVEGQLQREELPTLASLPGRRFSLLAAVPGRQKGDRSLVAGYDTGHTLLVCASGREGYVLRLPRLAPSLIGLTFGELDGDLGTRELILALGPNQGDGVIVRFDGRGDPVGDPVALDPRGIAGPRAARYLSALAGGERPGQPLVLARGAWFANDLQVFSGHAAGLRPAGAPTVTGFVSRLLLREWSEGQEVIAAHVENEEPWEPGWTRPGVAVYRIEEGAVLRPPRLHVPLSKISPRSARGWARGVRYMRVLETPGGAFLWARHSTGSNYHADPESQCVVIDLESPDDPLLINVRQLEPTVIHCVADLWGDGSTAIVARDSETGHLRILGAAAGQPPAAPPAEAELSLQEARQAAVPLLSTLGYQRQALARLVAEERDLGPTPASGALGLAVLRSRAVRSARAVLSGQPLFRDEVQAHSRPVLPNPAFVQDAQAFLDTPGRSLKTRSRLRLLLARHFLECSELRERRKGSQYLRLVTGSELLPEEKGLFLVLQRRARLLLRKGGRVVDYAAHGFPAGFLTNDTFRVRVEKGRGLVARISADTPLLAGVPVELPPGLPLRLEVEFSIRGQSWNAKLELGLIRDAEGGAVPLRRMEGMTVGLNLWQAAASMRRQELILGAGVGFPARLAMPRTSTLLSRGDFKGAHDEQLRHPFTLGGHFRAIVEHDPRDRSVRLELWHVPPRASEGGAGILLLSNAGHCDVSPSPGRYVFGLFGCGDPVVDDSSSPRWRPHTQVVLRRMAIYSGGPTLSLQRDLGALRGLGELGRAAVEPGAKALKALDRAARVSRHPQERASLALQRVEHELLAGTPPAQAVVPLRRVWDELPLELFRALAKASHHVRPKTRLAVARFLQAVERDLTREGVGTPALATRRAAARVLRGDLAGAWQDLDRKLPPSGAERLLWYWVCGTLRLRSNEVRAGILRQTGVSHSRERRAPRHALSIAPYWAPDAPGDRLQLAAQAYVAAPVGTVRQALLRRLLACPEPDLRRRDEVLRLVLRDRGVPSWLRIDCLKERLDFAPKDTARRLALAVQHVLDADYDAALTHMRGAPIALREAALRPHLAYLNSLKHWAQVKARLLEEE